MLVSRAKHGSNIEVYASSICDGLNEFLSGGLSFTYSVEACGGGCSQVIFLPEQDVKGEGANMRRANVSGEELIFWYDGKKISILGNVADWSVFDYGLHTGEVISLVMSSTKPGDKTRNRGERDDV